MTTVAVVPTIPNIPSPSNRGNNDDVPVLIIDRHGIAIFHFALDQQL